jgi:hypothetical protein
MARAEAKREQLKAAAAERAKKLKEKLAGGHKRKGKKKR